jgi:hypothetical protein
VTKSGKIVVRYYYQKGRIEHQLGTDPYVNTAIEILLNPAKYKEILSGKK